MPKLESPFVRKNINGIYVVTPKISKGYEWVFEDESVIATEKLNGQNMSIYIKDGMITHLWSKGRRIFPFARLPDKRVFIDAILNSYDRGWIEFLSDGQHFGEVVGIGVEGNQYRLKEVLWIPFETFVKENLVYKSWGKYPKTFQAISDWFKEGLMPLFSPMMHGLKNVPEDAKEVEGIVFVHPDGRMAKLRCDMFDWYKGVRHKE